MKYCVLQEFPSYTIVYIYIYIYLYWMLNSSVEALPSVRLWLCGLKWMLISRAVVFTRNWVHGVCYISPKEMRWPWILGHPNRFLHQRSSIKRLPARFSFLSERCFLFNFKALPEQRDQKHPWHEDGDREPPLFRQPVTTDTTSISKIGNGHVSMRTMLQRPTYTVRLHFVFALKLRPALLTSKSVFWDLVLAHVFFICQLFLLLLQVPAIYKTHLTCSRNQLSIKDGCLLHPQQPKQPQAFRRPSVAAPSSAQGPSAAILGGKHFTPRTNINTCKWFS